MCTPTFWTYVVISPTDIPFLKTRLKRSRLTPLDIVFIGWADENSHETELIESLRIIAPYANRWRGLTIDESERPFTALVIDEIKSPRISLLPTCQHQGQFRWYWSLASPSSNLSFIEQFSCLRSAGNWNQIVSNFRSFGHSYSTLITRDLSWRQSWLQCSNALAILTGLHGILIRWYSTRSKTNSILSTILLYLPMTNRIPPMTRVVLPSVRHFQVSVTWKYTQMKWIAFSHLFDVGTDAL